MGVIDITDQRARKTDSIFQRIRDEVIVHMTNTMPMEAVEWYRRNIDYNVSDGRLNNIMSVVDFVEILRGRPSSDDEYFKATLLGWCIRLLQASRLYVYSDDRPHKHRNQQCWYAGDDIMIKDSLWLDVVIYYLLKKYFRTETCYVHLLELFQDTTFQTEMGQLVKFVTVPKDRVDLSRFSLQRHALITRRNLASFYLPVALAMCICGVPESYALHGCLFSPYTAARSILLQLGEYFQIQADFHNYLDTVGEIGKAKSDIAENKCSWCINVALVVSSPEQRKVLEENYGQMDPEKEMQVKEIYEMNGLKEQYRIYEASMKNRIEESIQKIPEQEDSLEGCTLKKEVFSCFFDKVYKKTECEASYGV